MSTTVARLAARDEQAGAGLTWQQRLSRWDVKAAPYLYIAPFFLLFAVVGLFPLVYTGYLSMHSWHLVRGDQGFVGLHSFAHILQQPRFAVALRNTFSIFLLSSVPQVFLALIIAAGLNANLRAKSFWRMGVLLPYVVAPVAVLLIFGQLFADQSGTINTLLGSLGLDPIGWHRDVFWSHFAISVAPSTRRLPHDLKRNGARASLLLRAVGVGPARPHRAQEGAEPVPSRVPLRWLASDPGAGYAYAEGQRWTRDPRGSRVRSSSPRIPHDKVTQWLRPTKIPCQGAIQSG